MLTGRAVVRTNNFGAFGRRIAVAKVANVTTTAQRIQAEWKARAPRGATGEYADSIEVLGPGDNDFYTGALVVATARSDTNRPYPSFVEYGTRFMAPQPAATPAAEAMRQGFADSFRNMLR